MSCSFAFAHVAPLQIALAEIFPRAPIVRIERERLSVIVEALIDVAELARVVADVVQQARLILFLDAMQEV
jgi:hypothetical protein